MRFLHMKPKNPKLSLWFDWPRPVWRGWKSGLGASLLYKRASLYNLTDRGGRLTPPLKHGPLPRRRFLIAVLLRPLRRRGSRLCVLYCSSRGALRRLLALICVALPLGCTNYTHERLLHEGAIESSTIDTGHFQHKLFFAPTSAGQTAGKRLHLYIGGDGQPWRTPKRIATDPTSERALMLQTMLQDDSEAVYIGRPCYFQVQDARCRGSWWTHDRYHPEVIISLVKAVKKLATNHEELWLIGHSGGGALAVLVGHRLERPVKVVTVNANLDHRAWTAHHNYSPLTGSLNPIDDTARNSDMRELHWYTTEDRNILPKWVLAYCEQHKAQCLPLSGEHNTGWPAQWPNILQRSENRLAQP